MITARNSVSPMCKGGSVSPPASPPSLASEKMRRRSRRLAPAPVPQQFPIEAFAKLAPVVQYAAELLNDDPKAVEISAYARVTLRRLDEILQGCYHGQSVSGLLTVFARAAVFLQLKYNTQPIDPRLLEEMRRIEMESDESGCEVNAPDRESVDVMDDDSNDYNDNSTDISLEDAAEYEYEHDGIGEHGDGGPDVDDENCADYDENEINVCDSDIIQSQPYEFDTLDVYAEEDLANESEKLLADSSHSDFNESADADAELEMQSSYEDPEMQPTYDEHVQAVEEQQTLAAEENHEVQMFELKQETVMKQENVKDQDVQMADEEEEPSPLKPEIPTVAEEKPFVSEGETMKPAVDETEMPQPPDNEEMELADEEETLKEDSPEPQKPKPKPRKGRGRKKAKPRAPRKPSSNARTKTPSPPRPLPPVRKPRAGRATEEPDLRQQDEKFRRKSEPDLEPIMISSDDEFEPPPQRTRRVGQPPSSFGSR